MSSAGSLTEEEEVELNRAVLHELTRTLNGSTDAPMLDIQRLLDETEYQMEAEDRMNAVEDDDWQDIKKSRDNQSFPADQFVRLYDEELHTVYHVEIGKTRRSRLTAQSHEQGVSDSVNQSSVQDHQEVVGRPNVKEVLDRLTLENGHFAPRGYQEWMARKLQKGFDTENDIPGYGALCDRCHRLLTHSLTLYQDALRESASRYRDGAAYISQSCEVFNHYETTEDLRASASANCHFCSLINGPGVTEWDAETCNGDCNTTYYLQLKSNLLTFHANGFPKKDISLGWNNQHQFRPSTLKYTKTLSVEVILLARTWLNRCLREDLEACNMPTNYLPSRLVKITTIEQAVTSARLVLANEVLPGSQYLTLSHCWGGLAIVSLQESILTDYRSDIPLSSLSKTFREALQVTAWLGYQYIWIDSLCIIQDSSTDWKYEAARMGSIYRHSTCTIAATGARNGSMGLFFERSPLAIVNCPLFRLDHLQAYAQRGPWPMPLSDRAWAVQERYLSPRTLSFGSDKVSWSCRLGDACEGPDAHLFVSEHGSFRTLLSHNAPTHASASAWRIIVSRYSGCKLTLWKDKWPAFQGLASEVANAQGWEIVHGLRHHLLAGDLLWLTCYAEPATIELGEPSWSWLNVKGQVWLHSLWNREYSLDAEVVVQESSAPTDTGEVTMGIPNGVVRIEAPLVKFETSLPENGLSQVDCTFATTNPMFQPGQPDGLLHGYWYPDTIPIYTGDLWALHISTTLLPHVDVEFRYEGLVVVAAEGRPGYWRRVGTFHTHTSYETDADADAHDLPHPWNHEKTTVLLI